MRNKLVALLLGLALSGAAAGCSAGGSESASDSGKAAGGPTAATTDPRGAISGAYDAAVAAKTLRVETTMEIRDATETISMTGTGELDFEQEIARVEATMTGPTEISPELGNQLKILAIYTDEAVYADLVVMLGEEIGGMLGGKRWVKVPVTEASGLGGMFQGGFNDPRTTLASLRDFGSDVTVVGTETVRGTETAHYKTNLSVEALLRGLPENARAQAKKDLGATTSIPTEVWVSNDGQLRRLKMAVDIAEEGTMDITQEYYDFGADLDIKIPPADQVIDDPSVLGGLGGTIEG